MKIWFQNKRSKQKKVVKNVSHHSSSSSQPSNPNLSPHHRISRSIDHKSSDSMFLVKQEQHQQQPTSSSASASSSTNSNSFIIDAASSSSPYGHPMEYTNHFWSLPPPTALCDKLDEKNLKFEEIVVKSCFDVFFFCVFIYDK